jgi:hypothetical protein
VETNARGAKQKGNAIEPNEHVFGRHLPVHELDALLAFREAQLVQRSEARRNVDEDPKRNFEGKSGRQSGRRAPELGEPLPRYVIARYGDLLRAHRDGPRARDVRMLELGSDSGFA